MHRSDQHFVIERWLDDLRTVNIKWEDAKDIAMERIHGKKFAAHVVHVKGTDDDDDDDKHFLELSQFLEVINSVCVWEA